MGISKNPAVYGLNPSPFSGREGYKEFLEMPLNLTKLISAINLSACAATQLRYIFSKSDGSQFNTFTQGEIRIEVPG